MDGIEIVITPRTLERFIFSTIIIALAILLIIKWDSPSVEAESLQQGKTTGNTVLIGQDAPGAIVPAAENVDKCLNNVRDSSETDIDCGGECSACEEYKACNQDSDCKKGLYCYQRLKCLAPTCQDGIKNQDETETDCGGVCGGYYWKSDKSCRKEKEPSGMLDVVMYANIDRSPNSGNAIIKTVTLEVDNGLGRDLSIEATFYARSPNGAVIFDNQEGEISLYKQTFSVKNYERTVKIIDFADNTRRVLPGIKSTDKFQIIAILRDTAKKTLLDEYTWVNT
jgi:hypothetical protein